MSAADAPQAVYVPRERVDAAVAEGGTLVQSEGLLVDVKRREERGSGERHAKTNHVYTIVDGEAIFVTGGRIVGEKEEKPGEFRGSSIEGGAVHHMKKGDLITVPANTPHMWKDLPSKRVVYSVVSYQR